MRAADNGATGKKIVGQKIVGQEGSATAEGLRRTLAEQLEAVQKLPAALLRQAFRGEL